MAFSLFDMHIGAHEKVGTITYGLTSASTNALSAEDRTASTAHADDQFNGGTFYIISDPNTTANNGQFRRITDYDASSGQFTWTTAVGTSLAAGSEYGVATPEFNTPLMNRLANAALRTIGPFVYTDRTIQTSATQTVYTMSTVMGRSKPFQVDIQGRAGSSQDDPNWVMLHGWKIQPSTVGAGNLIVFPRSLPANRDIRIQYLEDHPSVSDSTAAIDSRIHPELATLALVEKMYEYRNSRARGAQDFDVQRWNDAKRQFSEARIRWPVDRPRKMPEITVVGKTASRPSGVPPYRIID